MRKTRWTAWELEALETSSTYAEAQTLLPHRTIRAIRLMAQARGLRPRRHRWTGKEHVRLRSFAGRRVSDEELIAAFPGVTAIAIRRQARLLGLSLNGGPATFADPLIEGVRQEARRQGVSLVALDRAIGARRTFSASSRIIAFRQIEAAASFLGLVIDIEWEPWP